MGKHKQAPKGSDGSTKVKKKAKTETSTSSLFTSIFGEETGLSGKDTPKDVFSSSTRWQELAQERLSQNQQKLKKNQESGLASKVESDATKSKMVLKARKVLADSKTQVVASITAHVPNYTPTTDEELEFGEKRMFIGRCDATFRQNGVLILKSLIARKVVKKLQRKATSIESTLSRRLDKEGKLWRTKADSTKSAFSLKLEQEHAFRYHEVASRCFGRLDSRYLMDKPPFNHEEVVNNPWLKPLIHSLLGQDAKLVYTGLILSYPDSADQPWHQDGEALFGDAPVSDLPPYALNVFMPLRDISIELGPTEFWVGSHKESICRDIMRTLQSDTNASSDQIIGPLLQKGDVLIYDYRICHRGTRNLCTEEIRPMLYLMYARPWFHEHLNFGVDRLFQEQACT